MFQLSDTKHELGGLVSRIPGNKLKIDLPTTMPKAIMAATWPVVRSTMVEIE